MKKFKTIINKTGLIFAAVVTSFVPVVIALSPLNWFHQNIISFVAILLVLFGAMKSTEFAITFWKELFNKDKKNDE